MSRRLHLTTLSLGFLVSLSCNSARINEAPECAAGDTSCDGTTITKPQPKPMPGASKIRIGPKAPIGFDTKQDGSYGVQTDKDGNVIKRMPMAGSVPLEDTGMSVEQAQSFINEQQGASHGSNHQ